MSCVSILQSVATWLTFVATDSDDDDPRTSVTYDQITVAYKKSSDTSFNAKALTGPPTDFREIGSGVYEIMFSAAELDTLGSFIFIVNSNGALPSPALNQYLGQGFISATAAYVPGSVSVSTNVLTGNLFDLNGNALQGEAVSARILSLPTVHGTSPNIGGVGIDIISAKTDASGFFALEVLQGAVVDITIPVVSYRRTLTVPSNATDSLFTLP